MAHLQVRDVPDDVYDELRRRAALDGVSLREYTLRVLRRDQRRPHPTEWLRAAEALAPVPGQRTAAEDLAALRGERTLRGERS